MSLSRKAFNKLYRRGYVDFVLGRADTSLASPINRESKFGSMNTQLEVGEFSCGMKWDRKQGRYVPMAKLSTSILCK